MGSHFPKKHWWVYKLWVWYWAWAWGFEPISPFVCIEYSWRKAKGCDCWVLDSPVAKTQEKHSRNSIYSFHSVFSISRGSHHSYHYVPATFSWESIKLCLLDSLNAWCAWGNANHCIYRGWQKPIVTSTTTPEAANLFNGQCMKHEPRFVFLF